MSNLAGTGLLRAGSGASTWKPGTGGVGVVTLAGASTPVVQQTIHVFVDGQELHSTSKIVAESLVEETLNQLGNTSDTL